MEQHQRQALPLFTHYVNTVCPTVQPHKTNSGASQIPRNNTRERAACSYTPVDQSLVSSWVKWVIEVHRRRAEVEVDQSFVPRWQSFAVFLLQSRTLFVILDNNKTARCLRRAWVWFWVLGLHEAAPEGLLLSPFPRFLYSKTAASVYSHAEWCYPSTLGFLCKGLVPVRNLEMQKSFALLI